MKTKLIKWRQKNTERIGRTDFLSLSREGGSQMIKIGNDLKRKEEKQIKN